MTTFARAAVIALLALISLSFLPVSGTAQTPEATSETLKVITIERKPFSFQGDAARTGFSIDLWELLAKELGRPSEFTTAKTFPEMLKQIESGGADAAIANISITSEREAHMDFSQPIFDSGLQILVKVGAGQVSLLSTVLSWEILGWVVIALILLFVAANLMWFFERRAQAYFEYPYREGMWRSFWWALNVIVNGGFEERVPQSRGGRVFAVMLVIASLFVVSIFVAKITAALTVGELRTQVQKYEDLYGKSVGTTAGSTSAAFLKSRSIRFQPFTDIETMFSALERGALDAVVHDAPIVAYYASTEGRGRVQTAGKIFRPEKYGIAFPPDSRLVEPINRALLRLRENGTYATLLEKWFGEDYQ